MTAAQAPAGGRSGALGRFIERWRSVDPRLRAPLALVGAVLAVLALLYAVDAAVPAPGGPASSSYSTAPAGAAAYADLLRDSGHPVERLREPLDQASLDPDATVVLLEPDAVLPADVAALRRFVQDGGRLVAGGPAPAWVDSLVGDAPQWSSEGIEVARPLAPVPLTADIESVRSAGLGSWEEAGAGIPVVGDRDSALLVTATRGSGTLVLLADVSLLHNALLGGADNAALGLALAGEPGRAVQFSEAVHGFGADRGLAALPARWKIALGGLLAAALLLIAARGRRLGPPEEDARPMAPARGAYVQALASALARTGRPDAASAPVREAARKRLAARTGLPADADAAELDRAAERLGLTDRERAALREELGGEDGAIAAGRALAHVEGGPR